MNRHDHRRDSGLVLIAIFKLAKAVLLIAVGLGAIGVVHAGIAHVSQRALAMVSAGTERRITQSLLARLSGMSTGHLEALGVGAFLYAALFLVEATGLWLQKGWAEYLTLAATASFVPFEVYELAREVTTTRVIALVVNLAVVIYLLMRVVAKRRSKHRIRTALDSARITGR